MGDTEKFTVETDQRSDAYEITDQINSSLSSFSDLPGVNVWVPHTTAGITVNESADPDVMKDMIQQFEQFIPWEGNYQHYEGNAAAHIKSMILGSHQWLPVVDGNLSLGRWQGVFLLEWDGPRTRTVELYPVRPTKISEGG